MPPPQVGPQEPPGAAPPQQRRQCTGRRPAPLRGPKIDRGSTAGAHPMPTLCPAPTLSVPTAWWSPCLPLPGSQSPNARPPNGSSVSRAAYRAQRGRSSRSSGGSRCPGPRPLQRAKSLPPHRPGASAWSWFLQQARGPLERDSCAEKKKPPTSLKWGGGGGEKEGRAVGGVCTPHPASICPATPHVTLLHHASPQVTPFISALTSARRFSVPPPSHFAPPFSATPLYFLAQFCVSQS